MGDSNKLHQGNLMPSTNWGAPLLISGGLVLAALAGVALYVKLQDQGVINAPQEERTVKNRQIPSDYFMAVPEEGNGDIYLLPNAKEETAVDQKTGGYFMNETYLEPNTVDEVYIEDQKVAGLQLSESSPVVQSQPLTTENAFQYPKPPSQRELLIMRREQLNAQRRGSGKQQTMTTIETIQQKKKKAEPPTDKDFSAHEDIGKDETTYPVNLERVITADRYIPCVLVDQINSQLAGRATCSLERNVYGFHGRKILLPAGSRVMGKHETLKKVGDERFNIVWERIIRPDGVHIKLTEAYASDRVGSTGLEGVINNRKWEKYGGAILTSTISALAQMSIPSEGSNNTRIAIESYGTDIGRVTAAMLQETINIKPYSIVPAGTRINITPTTDIWLKDTKRGAMFAPVEDEPQG